LQEAAITRRVRQIESVCRKGGAVSHPRATAADAGKTVINVV